MEDVVEKLGSAVREENQSTAGRVQRQSSPGPTDNGDGTTRGQALEVQSLGTLTNDQLHILPGDLVQVLEERQRHLPQAVSAGSKSADLPQPHSDLVLAVTPTLECALSHQLPTQPMNGRQR